MEIVQKVTNFFSNLNPEEILQWFSVITPLLSIGVYFKTFYNSIIEGSIPDNLYILKNYEQLYNHAVHKRHKDWLIITVTFMAIGVAALLSGTDEINVWLFALEFLAIIVLLIAAIVMSLIFARKCTQKHNTSITSYNEYVRKFDSGLFMIISLVLMLMEFMGFGFTHLTKDPSFKNVLIIVVGMLFFPIIEILMFSSLLDKYSESSHLAKGYFDGESSSPQNRKYIFFIEGDENKKQLLCGDIADAENIKMLYHDDVDSVKQLPIHIVPREIYDQIKVHSEIKREEKKLGKAASERAAITADEQYLVIRVKPGEKSSIIKEFKGKNAKNQVNNITPQTNPLQSDNKTLLNEVIDKTLESERAAAIKTNQEKIDEILDKMCYEVLSADENALLDAYYYNLVTSTKEESKFTKLRQRLKKGA